MIYSHTRFILPNIHSLVSHLNPLLQRRKLPQEMTRALIPARVVLQIQLMILFRIPPLRSRQDFRRNLSLIPLLVCLLRDVLGDRLLLVVVVKDSTAVLRSDVRALSVRGRGVVHAVEVLDELAVGEFGRVED